MSPSSKSGSKQAGIPRGKERRRSKRLPILSSFSLFVVVPKKGVHRLPVHDVSNLGIGFDLDTEGEDLSDFPLQSGDRLEIQFYLNQSLYLPLSVRVARIEERGSVRRLGVEISPQEPIHAAYQAFVAMLDALEEVGQILPV